VPITDILSIIGSEATETKSFPNLRLIETTDQRVYFDNHPKLVASALQTWLEMTSGDKRSKEAADPLRKKLLKVSKTCYVK
jgi:hypothetical protein